MEKTNLDYALEYLERGWCIIPIRQDTKRPAVLWKEYQKRLPTEDEITKWWTDNPDYALAIVTGEISGLVVVDCDNPEALEAALDSGMSSPIRAKTKKGHHLYFECPMDGVRRGPKVGGVGHDWPKIKGLDFRGDGSYALLPPSKNYSWEIPSYLDWDDVPVWKDWKPSLKSEPDSFVFSKLDLTNVTPLNPEDTISEWDKTAKYVLEHFPTTKKIPSGMGNARNERVMRYISECILDGLFGAELRVRGHAFMNEFFDECLPDPEFEATCASIEQAERRNHPERFNDKGEYIRKPRDEEKPRKNKLIQMRDAEQLIEQAAAKEYLIEPWLPRNTIVQVHGYSGHGKSLFIQNAMAALTSGRRYFGPFEIGTPARVLYLDFENGMATIARRLQELRQMHGDAQDRLNIWTPFVDKDMNLKAAEGLMELQGWIKHSAPDVVVIDTIRSAYSGLQENSADEWGQINKLAMTLRNSGIAVIMVHHSNKPSGEGFGREAGSTNQLTVLETQIRIVQVFRDEEQANQNAGIFDGNYEHPKWPLLEGKLPPNHRLYMVMEVRYGKVREWTDLHDPVQWIGFAQHNETEEKIVVSSYSTKQKAKDMALSSMTPSEIAEILQRPTRLVREWLGLEEVLPSSNVVPLSSA